MDLPPDARVRFGRQGFHEAGAFIRTLTVAGPGAARAMVQAHAAALAVPHEEGGTRLERVLEGRRPHSWFLFFWKDTAFKGDTLELNGYFWRDGLLFIFRNACRAEPAHMSRRTECLEDLLGRARRRSLRENPPGPGFCLRDAFIPGRAEPNSDEHIELLVTFKARPGLSLRFGTDTVGELIRHYPPLLERHARGWPRPRCPAASRLRAGECPIGPFPGQELVTRADLPGGGWDWACAWECLGRPRDPLAPMMVLEMKSRGHGPHGVLGERTLLALWDGVLGSLRRREKIFRTVRLSASFRSSLSM